MTTGPIHADTQHGDTPTGKDRTVDDVHEPDHDGQLDATPFVRRRSGAAATGGSTSPPAGVGPRGIDGWRGHQLAGRAPGSPHHLLFLQRMAGNRAAARYIARGRDGERRSATRARHASLRVHRQAVSAPDTATHQVAEHAEKQFEQGGGDSSPVAQMSIAGDKGSAEVYLGILQADTPKLAAESERASGRQDIDAAGVTTGTGGTFTPTASVNPAHVAINITRMGALERYLITTRSIDRGVSEFQAQFNDLKGRWARLDGVAAGYAGHGLAQVKTHADAAGMVDAAAEVEGTSTDQMASLFTMLQNNPKVNTPWVKLQSASQELQKETTSVSDATGNLDGAIASFDTATLTASQIGQGLKFAELQAAALKSKANAEKGRKLTENLKTFAKKGTKGVEELAKDSDLSATDVLKMGLQGKELAEKGAGIVKDPTKLLEPIQKGLEGALAAADASVGVMDPAVAAAMKAESLDKQKTASLGTALQTAKTGVDTQKDALTKSVSQYMKALTGWADRKRELDTQFDELSAAIIAATKGTPQADLGKALVEMLAYLREAEHFVAQAYLTRQLGQKMLLTGDSGGESDDLAAGGDKFDQARSQAQGTYDTETSSHTGWDGQQAFSAWAWQKKDFDGWRTAYTAVPFTMRRQAGGGFEGADAASGQGKAEGGPLSVKSVTFEALKHIDGMISLAEALRAQIAVKVFGVGSG